MLANPVVVPQRGDNTLVFIVSRSYSLVPWTVGSISDRKKKKFTIHQLTRTSSLCDFFVVVCFLHLKMILHILF